MFKGQLLDREQTVAFYQMKSDDSILAIPGQCGVRATKHWIAITWDRDAFSDSVNSLINSKVMGELLRLKDLRATRADTRRRSRRRLANGEDTPRGRALPSVLPAEAASVSEEPLPVCW